MNRNWRQQTKQQQTNRKVVKVVAPLFLSVSLALYLSIHFSISVSFTLLSLMLASSMTTIFFDKRLFSCFNIGERLDRVHIKFPSFFPRDMWLERQMTTRNRLDRGTRGSIPSCCPRERALITKLQTPEMKDSSRVFREGGGEDDRLTWTDFMKIDTACPIDYE